MKTTYKCIIANTTISDEIGTVFTKHECPHSHRTLSGARKCFNNLIVYSGGLHNEWSQSGEVAKLEDGELKYLTLDEQQQLNELCYNE